MLPVFIRKTQPSPLVVQGSKGKLVPWILSMIRWREPAGTYYEPFMGSGVVGLNVDAKHIVMSDNNIHLIEFFNSIKHGELRIKDLERYLLVAKETMMREAKTGETGNFFYKARDEFNANHDPTIFLFLNLACYKHLMRFNSKGEFNAPFFYDNGRHLTNENDLNNKKIIETCKRIMRVRDKSRRMEFVHSTFREVIENARERDFVYADPPYFGRNVNYYDSFSESDNLYLAMWSRDAAPGFAISNWYEDKNGKNPFMRLYRDSMVYKKEHHYGIENCQSMKSSDKSITECLVVKEENVVRFDFGLADFLSKKERGYKSNG